MEIFGIQSSKFFSKHHTDSEPTQKDLRMLVATKVSDYYALGTMLGLNFTRVAMIENEKMRDAVLINMKILVTWIDEETKMPTTWLTLVGVLCEMNMKDLAHDIIEKLEQKLKSS